MRKFYTMLAAALFAATSFTTPETKPSHTGNDFKSLTL